MVDDFESRQNSATTTPFLGCNTTQNASDLGRTQSPQRNLVARAFSTFQNGGALSAILKVVEEKALETRLFPTHKAENFNL